MNKRTFALLAAVITFTVGVVLAKLSLPNLFKTPPPVVIKDIQVKNHRLSGPYEFEGLSIFLIHGPDSPNKRLYTPLQDAMERQIVIVHGRATYMNWRLKICRLPKRFSFKRATS